MWESILSSAASKVGGEVLSKWTERKHVRALLELHKRKIKATRMANNYFPELSRLRETFLQHGLAEMNPENRAFFDKWLTHPAIEMGWAPANGWTLERISALHEDVEKLHV